MGETKTRLRTHGQQQKKLALSALALGSFSFRSSPMEMQPPVSPQQSECNPVGALQVCSHPHFLCMPVLP